MQDAQGNHQGEDAGQMCDNLVISPVDAFQEHVYLIIIPRGIYREIEGNLSQKSKRKVSFSKFIYKKNAGLEFECFDLV